jgi:hypothetical protein
MHDITFELIFEIDDVERKVELPRYSPRIVQVIERAAPGGKRFTVWAYIDSTLVPELHRKAHEIMSFSLE